jgi:alkylhydroperoxidase family enzyme
MPRSPAAAVAAAASSPSPRRCHARAPGGVLMPNRQTDKEDTMALRVPKAELSTEMSENMIQQLGAVPEPVEVLWHSPEVAMAGLEFSAKVGEWDSADASLKSFAHMAVAAQVGCSWCLDIGYFQAQNEKLDMAKASQVPRWRESEVFTPLERDVLEYAEAMTNTPPTVTDELSAGLLDRLGPAALVELTVFIAFSNIATRSNTALGIRSQGFSDACEIPLAAPPERVPA